MPRYCLDTDVFIQAKNGPYGFDIVPAFWDWLDQQVDAGLIFSSTMVYSELSGGEDELAEWVRNRRNTGFFIEPDIIVQQIFRDIANYVFQHYLEHYTQQFLDDADPWVIAHAKAENGIVVTHEALVPSSSKQVKIPNICWQFNVDCINPYKMLRDLNARFALA